MKKTSISTETNKRLASENFFMPSYWFGEIDTRWLSVFRILLGLLILKDAIYHLPLARIFYSDDGIIPRRTLFDGLVREPRFSLMDAMGQPSMAFLFFCIWIIVLILLIVGYRVRLMTILNFIIILSVHERNGYILTSADTLMRAMCFWMMFAPVGQYYSIDAIRRRWQKFRETGDTAQLRVEDEARTAFALPLRLIQMQLVIVYVSTGFLKAISPIWQAGEAMHYVVQIETFILPFGAWMRNWSPDILKLLSYFSMYAEIAIPILLLLPFVWRWSRLLAFILALMLHGGIAISFSIQDFSILMLICYLPFFEPAWLVWIENRLKQARQDIRLPRPLRMDSPLWMWLSLTSREQLPLLDETQAGDSVDDWSIEVHDENVKGQAAWRHIGAHLAFSRLWGWIFKLRLIRGILWKIFSTVVNYYQNKPLVPVAQSRQIWISQRVYLSVFLLPLFALLIMWNIEATGKYLPDGFRYPRSIQSSWSSARDVIWYTGLWQFWDMFSPTPIQQDGWLIVEGHFENEFSYDLLANKTIDYERPTRWYWGPGMRWEKFEENVFRGSDTLRGSFGSYYCRTFNENRDEGTRLATIRIVIIVKYFHAPDNTPLDRVNEQLWHHWCFPEYAPES